MKTNENQVSGITFVVTHGVATRRSSGVGRVFSYAEFSRQMSLVFTNPGMSNIKTDHLFLGIVSLFKSGFKRAGNDP